MNTTIKLLTSFVALAVLAPVMSGCDGEAGSSAKTTNPSSVPSSTGQSVPGPSGNADEANAVTRGAPPIVTSPDVTRNFGIVEPDSTLETTFELANPLDIPLRIITAQPSCTCTMVDMDGVVIPAKGTVSMPVTMTTNRAVGRKVAVVKLLIEGYSQPLNLTLNAENAWAVRSVPPHLPVREKADQPERRTGTFTLLSTDERPFKVLHVMDAPPDFVDFDPERDQPRERYTLRYDFSDLDCEQIPKFLIVHTDHPKARLIDLRVRHDPCTKIRKAIPMADFRSNLGELSPGSTIEFDVRFKNPRIPNIASVTSLDPRLEVTILDQVSDGKDLLVTTRVALDPGMTEGLFQIPVVFSDGTARADHLLYGWTTR